MIKLIYKIYYKLHLVYCFFFRPNVQGSYCLIYVGDQVLIIKNSYKSDWTIPCGRIDRGESPLEAAIREVKEEVGLILQKEKVKFLKVILNTTEYKKDHIHLYEYRMEVIPEVIIDDREVVDFQWIKVSDVETMPLFFPIKKFLLLEDK